MRCFEYTALAALMVLGHGVLAQSYVPLLKATATWQDENACASPGPNTSDYECVRYYLDGDSTLSDTLYQVLRRTGRTSHFNGIFPNMSYVNWFSGEFVALLREDTLARRVYIRPPGWPVSWLLYDFSVGVGPYPSTYRYYQWPDLQVTSVDTVWLNDGPHRRINFDAFESVIEGVGGISGFLESGVSGEIHWLGRLVCHVPEDSANYIVTSFDCACYSNVGVHDQPVTRLRIRPSPTVDLCYLEGAKPEALYFVRSLDGRLMKAGSCSNNGSATINLSHLPGGMYLIEVRDGNLDQRVKILKQ